MNKKLIVIISVILALTVALGVAIGIYLGTKEDISYTVNDTLPDGEGKRATVILLAGQSNAAGCSKDEYLKKNVSEEKYAEYEAGYDNVYINYFASGNNMSNGFVKCSVRQGEMGECFGPELGLAEYLNETFPNQTFFIIKYAWGATSLYDNWLSPTSKGKTGTLYKHFVEYVNTSLEYLVSKNYNIEIEGLCWMQGESDSFSTNDGEQYDTRLLNFLSDVRCEFAPYESSDGIAFVDAYIADNPIFWVYCDLVNESKKNVAESSPMNVVVDTFDLTTALEPIDQPDIAHYDSLSELELGRRFGENVSAFFD